MTRWPLMIGGAATMMVVALPIGFVLLLTPAASGSCTPVVTVPAGNLSQDEMAGLWVKSGGSTGTTNVTGVGAVPDPVIAGAVGMAESGGDPSVVNSIGAGGLWQIHPPEPDYLDPAVNARIAVRKFDASGWQPWEAFTGSDGRGDDGPWRAYLKTGHPVNVPVSGCDVAGGAVEGTPKYIIDTIVLPLARANGVPRTVAENDAANAAHGPTVSGGRSDHQGPPDVAWAADMSNGITTPQEDALAAALAERFGIPWHGAGLVTAEHDGYRFQLIYRTNEGGNHYTHVHMGVRKTGGTA